MEWGTVLALLKWALLFVMLGHGLVSIILDIVMIVFNKFVPLMIVALIVDPLLLLPLLVSMFLVLFMDTNEPQENREDGRQMARKNEGSVFWVSLFCWIVYLLWTLLCWAITYNSTNGLVIVRSFVGVFPFVFFFFAAMLIGLGFYLSIYLPEFKSLLSMSLLRGACASAFCPQRGAMVVWFFKWAMLLFMLVQGLLCIILDTLMVVFDKFLSFSIMALVVDSLLVPLLLAAWFFYLFMDPNEPDTRPRNQEDYTKMDDDEAVSRTESVSEALQEKRKKGAEVVIWICSSMYLLWAFCCGVVTGGSRDGLVIMRGVIGWTPIMVGVGFIGLCFFGGFLKFIICPFMDLFSLSLFRRTYASALSSLGCVSGDATQGEVEEL